MKKAEGMSNVQQIPGDTDFDDRPQSEEDRIRQKDQQRTPVNEKPIVPVSDPPLGNNQTSIGENSRPPQRQMRAMTTYERRIF